MNLNPIIKLPVAELKNNLVGLAKVVNRRSTLPILATIHVERDLPILATIHVERDRTGWVFLTATDLDCFATLRLEAPGQHGSPAKCLVPLAELQKLAKSCQSEETIELEPVAADKLILRHRIGSHPVEQVFTTEPVSEFPATPQVGGVGASLSENDRATLLNALQCVSDDETRFILTGIFLDVSKPESHYVVATNGRHLYASNSVHLPLKSSIIVPAHRFLSWGGFGKDGQWQLSSKEQKKDTAGYLKLESRRWTFITKLIEGNYPNWRQITVQDDQKRSGSLEFSDAAIGAVQRIVPRLPGDDTTNHTIGLFSTRQHLYVRGWNKDDADTTEIEVADVKISGDPATVYLNREYLLKALDFGLRHVQVQEPLQPLRFSDGGSRQMIVMPVRVDAHPSTRKIDVVADPSAAVPIPVASGDAPGQPTTNQHGRNQQPMQNGISSNGSGYQAPATDSSSTPLAVEKSSLEQALDQIEAAKGNLRSVVTSLNGLADTLRQVQRDRRSSEREIRSVRDMVKSLQTVRL